jgi:hypothetical protein
MTTHVERERRGIAARWASVAIAAWTLVAAGCGGGSGGTRETGGPGGGAGSVVVSQPPADVLVAQGQPVTIVYTQIVAGGGGTADVIADRDGDPATTADQVVVATGVPDAGGLPRWLAWDTAGATSGSYHLVVVGHVGGGDPVIATATGDVRVDVPPTLAVSQPASPLVVARGARVRVAYSDADPEGECLTWLYADRDGSLATAQDSVLLCASRPGGVGVVQTVTWDTTGVVEGVYHVVAQTWDGVNAPVERTAAGTVAVANVAFGSRIAGVAYESATSVSPFADGSVVVTGLFGPPSVTLGPGEPLQTTLTANGTTNDDAYVARYGPDGKLRWARAVTGTGSEIAYASCTLSDGSCVVAGRFQSKVTLGAGEPGQTTLTPIGVTDAWIARYGAAGNLLWAKRVGGVGSWCAGEGLATLADDSVVLTGVYTAPAIFGQGEAGQTTLGGDGSSDLFLARYAANGSLMWARRASGPGNQEGLGIAASADGAITITGWFDGTFVFGEGESTSVALFAAGTDLFVARYASNGSFVWARRAGKAGGYCYGIDVAAFPDGSCAVAGHFGDAGVQFGAGEPNATTLSDAGEGDACLARYDAAGHLVWARAFGGTSWDSAQGIAALPDGSMVVAGIFGPTCTFGAGEAAETTLTAASAQDFWIARYGADGSLSWVSQASNTLNWAQGTDVCVLPDGSYAACGVWNVGGDLELGAGQPRATRLDGVGQNDAFVARFNADGGF